MDASSNETLELMFHRRSLRQFSDKPVSPEDKDILLKSAMRAPTAGNLMSYTILDVTDMALKDRLAVLCDNQPMIAQAPVVLIFLADMQRLYDYFEHSGTPEAARLRGEAYKTPREGDFLLAVNDAVVAAQNVVIAAESMGMGSCYIGDVIENIEVLRDLLFLPRWTFPATMLILGYPKFPEKDEKLLPRFPTDCVVFENAYRRIEPKEFDRMFAALSELRGSAPFPKPAENLGQHIYQRKFASDFMDELRRSAALGISEWSEADSNPTP